MLELRTRIPVIHMTSIDLETPPKTHEAEMRTISFTRADLGAVGLLVATLVGMFWKVIFTSQLFFYRDVSNYTYPTTQFMRELCRHGVLPYWNPYLNYGQPMLGNPNLLFFYPYTLLILLLPFDLTYTLHFVVHFALAGIGTYLLARVWGQSYLAAFLAAFVFVFSGPVLSLGNEYNTVACCAWIPWALLAVHHALQSKRLRSWVLAVVVFSLQWLAAEPFSMMATFGLSFAYAFYRGGSRDRLWSKANVRLFAIFALVGGAVLLLCAVQFLPASDLLSHSRRGQGMSFRETTIWSVNPLSFLEVLTPNFSGTVLAGPPAWLWLISDKNDAYNISNFLGFVPFLFALAGWAIGTDRRRNFVAGAAVTLLLLSLGHYTPVFALARLLLPPLTVVRFPMKLLVHVTFLVAILAGWGFDALRNVIPPWKAPRKRLILPLQIFLGATILVLGAAWLAPSLIMSPILRMYRHCETVPFAFDTVPDYVIAMLRLQLPGLAGFCLGGVLVILGLEQEKKWARPGLYILAAVAMYQLVIVNIEANPTVPKSFYTYRPPVLKEFKAPPETYRFVSLRTLDPTANTLTSPTFVSFGSIPEAQDFPEIARNALAGRLQMYTGSMFYRVDGSINLDQERSLPPSFYDLSIYLNRMKPNILAMSCLLGRLNVKYILAPKPDDNAATRFIANIFNGSTVPSRLYEDLCFVPRTYVAGNSLFLTNSDKTLDYLATSDFDALNTVILAAPAGSAPSVSGAGPAGQVETVHRDPNSVTLRAQLARPAYIVLQDRYDPNWQATVDGQATPVLRANQIFRAVYANEGTHNIKFYYRQGGLKVGVIVTLGTLIALVVICVADPRIGGPSKLCVGKIG
jgi:hypothetical protein